MTEIVDILDAKFLEFLQEKLVKLCKGKVSIVFEDLQSRPITGRFPKVRVFAPRKEGNVCQCMIDCPENEKGQLKCLLSDASGANMARTNKKGYLYRCHQGRGVPNFLFPIVIWPEEVIGYLYVGQFVFKELSDAQRQAFLKKLEKSGYIIEDPKRFVSGWSETDYREFYEYVIEPRLREQEDFKYPRFKKLIADQVKYYGLSPDEFFDIVKFIEGLASELSNLGNALHTLTSIVEIERRLSPFQWSKHYFALSELRNAAYLAINRNISDKNGVQKMGELLKEKSLGILMDCKNYEDEYIGELTKPYMIGIIKPDKDVTDCILQFYARGLTFEAILYSKLRDITQRSAIVQDLTGKGDELIHSLFNVLSSCGQQFEALRELVKELFLEMYREKEVRVLLKDKLVPCMLPLFKSDEDLKTWLVDHGIADLSVRDYEHKVVSFSRTLDLIVDDMESTWKELKQVNQSLANRLKRITETVFVDLGYLAKYVRFVNSLRTYLSKKISDDRLGMRNSQYLKAYKVFLNSGGLTSTHKAALIEQQKWLAQRNEEGPIGMELEKELEEKVEKTRSLVARFIGARTSDSIVFTHNTTSSIDLVLRGLLKPGDEILTTDLEHDVVYYLKEYYEKHLGCNFVIVPVSKNLLEGKEWLSVFTKKISRRTKLIIMSHILFSTGTILPIKKVVKECRKASEKLGPRKIFILVDGAHAVGNVKVNVEDIGCDFYAFDGHKWLLGPEGTGILYCKEEYLRVDNPFGIHLPISTAYMVSPKYAPKKHDGKIYELGTMNVANIIGLGASVDALSKLKFSEIAHWRKILINKFSEAIKGSRWKIINPRDAIITGMVCLQINGDERRETYEKVVSLLGKSNIIVRYLENPPCIRLCIHHHNNETDIKIVAFHLKALLEGVNVHIGNHEKIGIKLRDIIQSFLAPNKPSSLASFVGLNLFSIPGAGKSYVVRRILEDLKNDNIIKNDITIRAKDILKLQSPEAEFASIIDNAWKETPAVIFIDEADALFEEKQKGILGIFNDESTRILKDKSARIVFITAENDPYAIYESAATRLKLAYFPLPDYETRLKYLQNLARGRNCSSELLLTEIARLTKGYSMRDLKNLWEMTVEKAEEPVLRPEHFHMSLESLKKTASDEILRKYADMIRNLKPKLFTGEIEID
jgi:selenocysteine lyase/cysteine desulfurase